jgi:hypothetical protein
MEMNKLISVSLTAWLALMTFGIRPVDAQPAYYVERSFGTVGTNVGQLSSSSFRLAQGGSNLIFCADGTNIKVFTTSGQYVRQWNTSHPQGDIAASSNEVFYLYGNVICYDLTGGVLRTISTGAGKDIRYDERADELYILRDTSVAAYSRSGTLLRVWGSAGSGPGQIAGAGGLAILRDSIAVGDNDGIELFSKSGAFIRQAFRGGGSNRTSLDATVDQYVLWTGNSVNHIHCLNPRSGIDTIAQASAPVSLSQANLSARDNTIVANNKQWPSSAGVINVLRRGYRSMGGNAYSNPPLPEITNMERREGSSIVDIDYTVTDLDSASVSVGALGILSSNASLASVLPMKTLVEGTSTNRGGGIIPGQTRRLSWDAGADMPQTNYSTIRFRIMAEDERPALGFSFITVPASGTDGSFLIDQSPLLATNDLLNLWMWLVATNDNTVVFSNGTLTASGGAYSGQLLASGTVTTATGRQFLFARLGVREATPAEIGRATTGTTPGVTNRFASRNQIGLIPAAVNEISFDTGSGLSPTNAARGVWVVPLP